MSSNDVRLAIEGNQESFIQEIALNGQETWIQPLSMGEKLQLSTQKIDFFKELDRDVKPEPDSEEAVIIDEPQGRFWNILLEGCFASEIVKEWIKSSTPCISMIS